MTPVDSIRLSSGGRVAVIGGGPAGSFFSYFAAELAETMDLALQIDVYEPRDFSTTGPAGCNMCGGIVSESLVQMLATEGILLPDAVVERGLDAYVLHMEEGSVRIETPIGERRIAAVHRGAGPRGSRELNQQSLDGYLLGLAQSKGVHVIRERADGVVWEDGRPRVSARGRTSEPYDLLVIAAGVNGSGARLFAGAWPEYQPPRTTKTYISELYLGQEAVGKYLGSAMQVFLLAEPRLEFAALIPKGDFVTACLMGHEIDAELVRSFMESAEVKRCLPPDWSMPKESCHCSPRINVSGAVQPFGDRIVFVGDSGVTRLFKDGIGAAYRTAKAAAVTSVIHGISADAFRSHYAPICRQIEADNRIGRVIFTITGMQRVRRHDRRGILRMVQGEQARSRSAKRMSSIMWDLFTGSASYRSIFLRAMHPLFILGLIWEVIAASVGALSAGEKQQEGGRT